MKIFNILGVLGKIRDLGGGFHKKLIYRGDCLKRGPCTVCRFKEWLENKEEGGLFEGCLIPKCTLWHESLKKIKKTQ